MLNNAGKGIQTPRGQALAEFAVTLTLLVPLLLLLPAIGKLFEVKNKTTQLGTLSAWQPSDSRRPSDSQARHRLLTAAILQAAHIDDLAAEEDQTHWDPMLLDGTSLLDQTLIEYVTNDSSASKAPSALTAASKLLSKANFPLKTQPLERHTASIDMRLPDFLTRWLEPEFREIPFEYQLSVFKNDWQIIDRQEQVRTIAAATTTSLLPKQQIQSFLKHATGFMPWTSAFNRLELGRIDTQIVPQLYLREAK